MNLDAGDKILFRFQEQIGDILNNSKKNREGIKASAYNAATILVKWRQIDKQYKTLHKELSQIPEVFNMINEIAVTIGQLEAEMEDVTMSLAILEDICRDEERVVEMRKAMEEVHVLKFAKQKELEALKGRLANQHISLLSDAEKQLLERRQQSNANLNNALSRNSLG